MVKVFYRRTIQTALVEATTIFENQNMSVSSFVSQIQALLTTVHPCIRDETIEKGTLPNCTCWLTALSSVTTFPATRSLKDKKSAWESQSKQRDERTSHSNCRQRIPIIQLLAVEHSREISIDLPPGGVAPAAGVCCIG